MLIERGRALTSDCRIVDSDLVKLRCRSCGLARTGTRFDARELADHYGDYALGVAAATAEPLFFTNDGPIPRSEGVFAWLREGLRTAEIEDPSRILEIGAGEGSLLSRFADAFPAASVYGLDMSEAAAELARRSGVDVAAGSYLDVSGEWDLIYAVAVLEHVPAPAHFLETLGGHLTGEGLLLVGQPCQDVPSSEIFFVDHLHHFCSHHPAALAGRAGLEEAVRLVGAEPMTTFSLHGFRPGTVAESNADPDACGAALREEIARWRGIFARIDEWLADRPEPLAVWGVGQTFALLRAYSDLGDRQIDLGIDENPERFAGASLGFPVVAPDALGDVAPLPEAVLFSFSPKPRQRERLRNLDVVPFAPLAP